jgi:hypothetical protein
MSRLPDGCKADPGDVRADDALSDAELMLTRAMTSARFDCASRRHVMVNVRVEAEPDGDDIVFHIPAIEVRVERMSAELMAQYAADDARAFFVSVQQKVK